MILKKNARGSYIKVIKHFQRKKDSFTISL